MKRLFLFLLALLILAPLNAQTYQPTWDSIDKRPTPAWFADAKFGIFIHWGVYSVPAYAPVIPGKLAYAEWYWHQMTEGRDNPKANAVETGTWAYHKKMYGADYDYKNFAPQFRAELFDPDQWASYSRGLRAQSMWCSPQSITKASPSGPARKPLPPGAARGMRSRSAQNAICSATLSDAVRRKGLRMGIYYSLYEWYNPLWLTDKPRYVSDHMFPQFKDVVTRYKPSIIFSDGEWEMPSADWRSPELLAWLFNDSPVKDDVVINDRWGSDTRHKHGGYWTTEYTAGMSGMEHPWEESRGMGFSYGYNRAERLQDYHTGRDLVIMLVDIVSRGGNLLLDIGPTADGTIPVIMQDRLHQIGDWLKVNGDAIYGTRPWTTSRQWSAGEVPTVKYNSEFESAYDVTTLVGKPEPGKASIEAFFTTKGNNIYAILPHWPGGSFLLKDVTGVKSVTLLGSDSAAKVQDRASRRSRQSISPAFPTNCCISPHGC